MQLAVPTATVLAVGQDITDRLALEQRTAANQALAAVGTLTTGLAHEIRNPLNAAKLQLELIQRRAQRGGNPELAARLVEPANLVRAEIERLTKMLDEFLNLARPSSPVRVAASAADLFAAVLASEGASAARAGIVLRADLSEPDLRLEIDADKIKAALLHLVRNSIDALSGRGQGEIMLYASRAEDGGVELCVLDDGPGLPPGMQGRAAFEPFATTKPAGTGLGLALVQSAVAQHGGEVELSSRREGGTLARIRLRA
jgi:two-component system sensor histidine kinase HydH